MSAKNTPSPPKLVAAQPFAEFAPGDEIPATSPYYRRARELFHQGLAFFPPEQEPVGGGSLPTIPDGWNPPPASEG